MHLCVSMLYAHTCVMSNSGKIIYAQWCMCAQSCLTLCDSVDCSPPGSSVHGILQARILDWVAMSCSRGSSWPRDRTRASFAFLHWQADSLPLHCHPGSPFMHSSRLQSMGSLRVGHDWATSLSLFTFLHWRRKWQPTPVFLPGESQGWGSLVGCCQWGCTESNTTEET